MLDEHVDATRQAGKSSERALVLAGGGAAGNAWELGLIAGLSDAGVDVTEADLIRVRLFWRDAGVRRFDRDTTV
jgi:hypothetical protein